MRKAIVSLGAGPQTRLLSLAARSFRPYAQRHGYELLLHTEVLDKDRPASWSKVPLLRALAGEYDLLLWLDADLVIVDRRLDIASELVDGRFLYMVEHITPAGRMPNAGVLMLRGGPQTIEFLDEVYAQQDLIHHQWWENAAICRLFGYNLDPVGPGRPTPLLTQQTKLISGRWNSIRDAPSPSPSFNHYPGYSLKVRAAFMTRDLIVSGVRSRLSA